MCELTLAIRARMLHSYAYHDDDRPGLIDHDCMSAAEGAVEALAACGLSDGRFRRASVAGAAECAAFTPTAEQELALAHAFFDLEVVQHQTLPDNLAAFTPPDRLLAACEQLVMRDDLVRIDGGFAWPLDRLTRFRRGYLHHGPEDA